MLHRRTFLGLAISNAAVVAFPFDGARWPIGSTSPSDVPDDFPRQPTALVKEMVSVAHTNLDRVRELLRARPALADASIDWGFGDWESALGAASHVGRADIAEELIANGAAPTLFSAVMLGQLKVVEAAISASPGVQKILGPHSITLLAHARAGGDRARDVLAYLEKLGDADRGPAVVEMSDAERAAYVGVYEFGSKPDERLEVAIDRTFLAIKRTGGSARRLIYLGSDAFAPVGSEAVRVRFARSAARVASLAVLDADVNVTATRMP